MQYLMARNRKELADGIVRQSILRSQRIIDAFMEVDRADFVPSDELEQVYEDIPLSIGYGQTISQPLTVAFMLELLKPQRGNRILDIGSGSGWTTALLAHIVGHDGSVTGVEIIPQLVAYGKKNLRKYDFPHAKIVQGHEDILGLPDEALFDRILVSAAAREFPHGLLAQLRVGGRIVIPIEGSIWMIEKKSRSRIVREEHPGFAFVPLRYDGWKP